MEKRDRGLYESMRNLPEEDRAYLLMQLQEIYAAFLRRRAEVEAKRAILKAMEK